MKLSVYQVGVGDFGRYGFEKLVELHNHFDRVDVQLKGLCDSDFEGAEKAERFAEANGIEIELFTDIEEMYEAADREENPVMVYDAGPTETHADNIYRSLHHGFYHLAEKPPSTNRGEHIKEKRLANNSNVMWKADFIERENPVVRKALELVEGESIEEIKVFRQSSVGIEKMLDPVKRAGVKGGDVLDKMVHEVYILDLLEAAGQEMDLEIENAESKYFLPKKPGSEKFMSIKGGYTDDINYETATAMTSARFQSGGTDIELHSSWVGASDTARIEAQKVRDRTGHKLFDTGYSEMEKKAFKDSECRFFVIKGGRELAGDMLHHKLFDLESGEEIELDEYLHDPLYRVIEKSVLNAAGEQVDNISEKEIDVFMNAVFDVKEEIGLKNYDFLEELENSNEKIRNMILDDRKILETRSSESLAG